MSETRPPSHPSLQASFGRQVPEKSSQKADAKQAGEVPRAPEASMAILRALMRENNIAPIHRRPKSMGVAQIRHRGVVSLLVMVGMTATVSMAVMKTGYHERSFVNLTPQVEATINAYFASSGSAATPVDAAGQIPSLAPANLTQHAHPRVQPGISSNQPQEVRIVHGGKGWGLVKATPPSAPADGIHHRTAAQHRPHVKADAVPAWAQYMKPSDAAQLVSDLKATSSA